MRVPVFLLLCWSLPVVTWAQSALTNGEIHDYQVGDVYQCKGEHWNMFWQEEPPGIYTDTILAREELDGGASIRYIMKHWAVVYQYMPEPPLVTSSIDTLLVTDLDQLPDTSYDFCDPGDTTENYGPLCGRLRWSLYDQSDSCLMEEHLSYWFYQGCGGPYFEDFFEELGGSRYDLIYYNKQGVTCGQFWDLPTALPQQAADGTVRIGPNPTTGLLRAEGLGARGALIIDAFGRRVAYLMNARETDIGRLPAATYWVVGEDVNGRSFRRPIIKN